MTYWAQKQSSSCRRCVKCSTVILSVVAALFLVLSASILSPGLSTRYPFHAQCQLRWTWSSTNCSVVHNALLHQIQKWDGPENCKTSGEKCLYELLKDGENDMHLQHTTPVKKYVDSISFNFCDASQEQCESSGGKGWFKSPRAKFAKRSIQPMEKAGGCTVAGFSHSLVWYAILDYGTNYCNMRNLADGAGLTKLATFVQDTDDDICTQYSSANCDVY